MTLFRTLPFAIMALGMASPASATNVLVDLPSVERALGDGDAVSVVLDLSQCQPASAETHPTRTRGGRRIDAYRVTEDGTLAFADDHFTIGRDGKPIRQFLRYQVHGDGTAQFSMTVFSMPDLQRVGPTLDYACTVNKGMRFVDPTASQIAHRSTSIAARPRTVQ